MIVAALHSRRARLGWAICGLLLALLLAARPAIAQGKQGKLMKMEDAVKAIGAHLNMRPIESGMTLPIPTFKNGQVLVHRLTYHTRLVPNEGTYLTPPDLIATADLTAGKFVSVQRFVPEVKVERPEHKPADWLHRPPTFESPQQLLDSYQRLYRLYDVLIPAFAGPDRKSPPREAIHAAREFSALFKLLSEPPLRPYYDLLGREFFAWVEQTAKDAAP